MTARRAGKRHKHAWLKWAAGAVLLAFILLGVAISIAIHRAEPMLRAAIVEKLEEHFHARVELDSFQVSLVDGLRAEGEGLRIWPSSNVAALAVPEPIPGPDGASASQPIIRPLIQLAEFRFHTQLRYKPGEPIRIAVVELEGLNVDIPPKPHLAKPPSETASAAPDSGKKPLLSFLIESID